MLLRLTDKKELTFGVIAGEWAREAANTPRALNRDGGLL